jgi:hypothetical protein
LAGKPEDKRPAEAARTEREARLAAALRENLRRRKAQARARQEKAAADDAGRPEPRNDPKR